MQKKIVTVYSILHFIVDLSCAVLITNLITAKTGRNADFFVAMLIYNFFAFAMQLPIGIIADKINKNALCAATGCLLVAVSFGLAEYALAAGAVAGLGNAMFHIGGGIDVLHVSRKKATLSGVFVSTGALGIFLGGISAKTGFHAYFLIVAILLLAAMCLIWLYLQIKNSVQNEEMTVPKLHITALCAVVCFMITVSIRSYVGLILAFEWKENPLWAVGVIVAVILGKVLGGIIGDKTGFEKMLTVWLAISAGSFIFAFQYPILGVLAVLCFNMTMPITLTALSNLLYRNKGMAFGLLTFALFLGALPKFFEIGTSAAFTPGGLCVLTIVSWVVLYIGIKKYNICPEK